MNRDRRLTTSPLLFGYRGSGGRVTLLDARTGDRHRLSGGRGAEIALAFLEPRSIAGAEAAGFRPEEIEAACDAGLIVDEEECERVDLWERAGWSRPAYLMFSQMNLEYVEAGNGNGNGTGTGTGDLVGSSEGAEHLGALTRRRRGQVEEYQQVEDYPSPRPLASGESIALPAPSEITPSLDSIAGRRSVRAFSRHAVRADQLGDVLYAATASLRIVAADRASGDPFRLLNSLYSWAHLFVVVQDVDNVPGGVFEYDWSRHRLLKSAGPPRDAELASCVQGQRWVLGPGFAVFVVGELRGYAWLYRHSRAYIHVLIQLGELAQEILMAGTALGLGGWTTPAVHESRSAALLGLPGDDGIEVLSMTKLAYPLRRHRRD
jgi:SagB-type dehydrogenase family enzyme